MATDRNGPARADDARSAAQAAAGASVGMPEQSVQDAAPRVVTSESLLNGATQLAILHDRTLYYLRQTRYGKLILTK